MNKIRYIFSEIGIVIRDTLHDWVRDNMPTYGAALAFYAIFSIAPLLIILVAVTGFIFGEAASAGQLEEYMSQIMGAELAMTLQNFVANAYRPASGIIATMISLIIILFTSTTIITQLKESLNNIWNVAIRKEESSIKRFLIDRMMAFALILIFAGIFILSMIFEITLSTLSTYLDPVIPGGVDLWSTINSVFIFLVQIVLFGIIFKMLPDIRVQWSDVAVGAVVTALLFLLGRYLISIYMGMAATSTYGAAGSFVVFLIWVYYNAMVFFLGAEFTYIYTMRYGSRVEPADHARFTTYYLDDPDDDTYGSF
ncbi:MAG: YihY/virulence factor BrkB family protein [Balneolales bacterium]